MYKSEFDENLLRSHKKSHVKYSEGAEGNIIKMYYNELRPQKEKLYPLQEYSMGWLFIQALLEKKTYCVLVILPGSIFIKQLSSFVNTQVHWSQSEAHFKHSLVPLKLQSLSW